MHRHLFLPAMLAALLTALPAFAHAVLKSANPPAQASVTGPDIPVALTFNSRIDANRSRIIVKDERGAANALPVSQGATAAILTATAKALPPGRYVLSWEVLSVDGHVTRGDYPFTVTEPTP